MKKILVIYYTQTGQAKTIVDSIISPLSSSKDYQIDYFSISPIKDFPYPWTDDEFYDCMPECVDGDTIEVNAFDVEGDYDLVILSYQVWFLSLSIPFWSMLQDEKLKAFLKNKNVITVLGVRNMWVNANKRIYKYFEENKVNHVGNLVFADPNSNLISVITVLKFLTTANKKPYKKLPPYGVTEETINNMSIYGKLIENAIENNNWNNFQREVVKNNGVAIEFSLKTTELAAGRIFKVWSAFIKKKGGPANPKRKTRLKIYKFYLLFLIFFISPISSTIFKIIHIVFRPFTQKGIDKIALLETE